MKNMTEDHVRETTPRTGGTRGAAHRELTLKPSPKSKNPSLSPRPMQELAAVKLVVRRSRFFAHFYRLENADEIEGIMKSHRRKYRKARHHCYAQRLLEPAVTEKFKDDGEVGHPGKVLLEILKKNDMGAHALVVSRVFGGIKLGVGGVSRAFREAGEGAVEQYISSGGEGQEQ